MQKARTILNLCEKFHCLPSQLDNEDASLLRLLAIADRAGLNETQDDYFEEGEF